MSPRVKFSVNPRSMIYKQYWPSFLWQNKEKEETNQTALIENLTQQLTQTRDKIRDQVRAIFSGNLCMVESFQDFSKIQDFKADFP